MSSIRSWFYRNNQGGRITTLLLFLPPALTIFTLFVVLPLGEAGYYGFFKWKGLSAISESGKWMGFENYSRVLGHSVFHSAIWNTIKIILVSILIQLPLAMAMALLVASTGALNNFFRLVFFMPFILADVVAGLIWRYIFDGDYGLVGQFTTLFGMDPYYPLADKTWAFNSVLMVVVWKYFGYHMMIYIAGLQGISKDLLEAAKIDGANNWQITFRIKIPLIMHAVKLSVFFSVIGALQFFEMVIPMLPGGGPSSSGHTIVTYLYTYGIVRMKVGFGSSVGVILFIVCMAFAFSYQRYVMKMNND